MTSEEREGHIVAALYKRRRGRGSTSKALTHYRECV